MSSEERLVARLRAGEGAAFDEAYERYRARLYSFLVRLTQRRALAEDLLQETWMRLASHAPGLAPDTRLASWLFTVARNLFVSQRRWAMLDAGRLSEMRMWSHLRGGPTTPFAVLAADEAQRKLEQALTELPFKYREVVLLVSIERMGPSEAAGVLGLSPAAVRQRLARARAMLRQVLEREHG